MHLQPPGNALARPLNETTARPMTQDVQPQAPMAAHPATANRWYVCLTKPRVEATAVKHLQEQGYETYLPELRHWVRQQGQWVQKAVVMFPRYVFVRPGRAGQAIGPVRSTPGISTLVSFGHVLASLREEKLEALRTLASAQAAASPHQPFDVGHAVVFNAGPLKGASGIVSQVAAERVHVLMTLLGQDHRVSVPARDLALA